MLSVLLVVLCLRGQTPLTPDLAALAKIRARMIFNLKHQPNYTCVETIERSSRPKLSSKLKMVDVLRLEVALVDGRELFAWPGSKKFEDTDVTQMITTGAIGNGNFGTHAQALFTTRAATFHYLGEQDFQGKKAIRFDYNVPQFQSGYRIRVSNASAIVGYHGSFYANPATFDMERIQVLADNLPLELNLSSTEDKIDYAVTRIGDGDFLLPDQSELSMVGLQGGEERNHVKFTSCRQFSGESVVSFDEAPTSKPDEPSIPAREFDLPDGLDIELALTNELDLRNIAVGDPVSARVNRDVKKKGQVVIPKGAMATGRITRHETYDTYSVLGVEFPDIAGPGILAHMKGSLVSVANVSVPRRQGPMRNPRMPGEGIIAMVPTQLHLFRGCIIFWRT